VHTYLVFVHRLNLHGNVSRPKNMQRGRRGYTDGSTSLGDLAE
jgi:hypothetical protein